MSSSEKHFRFINSKTGYVIFYYSVDSSLGSEQIKEELRKVHERVASQNNLYIGTVYWEEIPED